MLQMLYERASGQKRFLDIQRLINKIIIIIMHIIDW